MASKENNEKSQASETNKGSNSCNTPKDTAKEPMEMAASGSGSQERGVFNRLYMKFGERVGTVKTSDFSDDFIALAKDADTYKDIIFDLSRSIMKALQHNRKFFDANEGSAMECEAPPGLDPFEVLAKSFVNVRNVFPCAKTMQVCENAVLQMAKAHRQLQMRGRNYTRRIRKFLNVTWMEWNEEREKLLKLRQEMDFARHEYTGHPDVGQQKKVEAAEALFRKQYERVYKQLSTLPEIMESHRLDVIYVLYELAEYNSACAVAAQPVANLCHD
uniref:BAR domain-containing protein n=1 Tax=Steinernema glaseri TaxID=37863 RepID=A0A1I7YWM9_9BILA